MLDLKNTLEEGNTTPFSVAVVSCVAMRYQITNDINPKVATESPMYYGVGLGRAGTHIITHDIKSTVNKSSDLNVAQALSTGGSSGAITMDIAVKDEVESPHYEGVGVGMAFTKIITHDINSKATNSGNTTVAYRGETGYSEAGATSATITKGTTEYPSGTKVQTMVEQPLFYTKVVPVKSSVSSSGRGKKYDKARFYISPTPKAGFKPVDGFLDDNGILQDKIYLSAFEGSIFDTSAGAYLKADEQVADFATDMLSSIAGAKPASGLTQNLTRANVRKLCTNRGKGWKSHNIFALTATQWLILVEYASMNAQSVIGQGVSTFTDDGSTNMAVVTGATSGLGNGCVKALGYVQEKLP